MFTFASRRIVAFGSAFIVLAGLAVPTASAVEPPAATGVPAIGTANTTLSADAPDADGSDVSREDVLDLNAGLPITPASPEQPEQPAEPTEPAEPSAGGTIEATTGVDPAVTEHLTVDGRVPVVVRLVEQADLAAVATAAAHAADRAAAAARARLAAEGAPTAGAAAAIDEAADAARAQTVVEALKARRHGEPSARRRAALRAGVRRGSG